MNNELQFCHPTMFYRAKSHSGHLSGRLREARVTLAYRAAGNYVDVGAAFVLEHDLQNFSKQKGRGIATVNLEVSPIRLYRSDLYTMSGPEIYRWLISRGILQYLEDQDVAPKWAGGFVTCDELIDNTLNQFQG